MVHFRCKRTTGGKDEPGSCRENGTGVYLPETRSGKVVERKAVKRMGTEMMKSVGWRPE